MHSVVTTSREFHPLNLAHRPFQHRLTEFSRKYGHYYNLFRCACQELEIFQDHCFFPSSVYNIAMTSEEKLIQQLTRKHQTLATAESCSGGLLAHRLTDIPGSSAVFLGGLVTYSNDAKTSLAGVPQDLISQQGSVSDNVAVAMACGVRRALGADFGVGITGIAGPGGATKSKPVGLVFIAVATANESLCIKCLFDGTRAQIKHKATTQALRLLREFLE